MSFVYIWKSANLHPEEARAAFADMLARQSQFYTKAFGHAFQHTMHQNNTIFVGQIHFDMGVKDWRPWLETNGMGIAWSGICETFLGATYTPEQVKQIFDTVIRQPDTLGDWDGRFAVCTWDTDRLLLTTGATESTSLWFTEGPQGWAAGSHALPLLELVGRQPELDPDAANLLIAYGYLLGQSALSKGVQRLPPRRQVRLVPNNKPSIHTYLLLGDYLDAKAVPASWQEKVQQSADRVLHRVSRQLAWSSEPHLLLTGGRDSRCIAAAAVKAGYSGTAHTTGPDDSPDVRVAIQVAQALGVPHKRLGPNKNASSMMAMVRAMDEVHAWIQISEGVETIRHAVPYQAFFERKLPFPIHRQQMFHGLHSFGNSYYEKTYDMDGVYRPDDARSIVLQKIPGSLVLQNSVQDALLQVCEQIDHEADGLSVTLGQWLNLFYWQTKGVQWGEDMMSVKDLIDWHWAPLFDRQLIQMHWGQRVQDKIAKSLIQQVTLTLAPQLKGVTYEKDLAGFPATLSKIRQQIKKGFGLASSKSSQVSTRHTSKIPVDQYLLQFWDDILFCQGEHAWPEFIEEEHVRGIIAANPLADTLWRIATVDLVAQVYCK